MKKNIEKFTLPIDIKEIILNSEEAIFPESRAQLFDISLGNKENSVFR